MPRECKFDVLLTRDRGEEAVKTRNIQKLKIID